jgi:SAM-dependent methyltransferase
VTIVERVERSPNFAPHERYYWRYQFLLGEQVLVPLMRSWGLFAPGMRVFEFGCGEAGVLGAFAHAGASWAVGADISEYRIEVGRRVAVATELPLELERRDLLSEPIPLVWRAGFDLVLMRDVIEHLEDTERALAVVDALLSPGGAVLVTFPPYLSPFGGHQHLLRTWLGSLPWVHLVPGRLFAWIVGQSERPADQEEVRRLREIALTIGKFERALARRSIAIVHKQLYLLRPVFRFKFGLPSLQLPRLLWRTPLAELLALEALYVLRPGAKHC